MLLFSLWLVIIDVYMGHYKLFFFATLNLYIVILLHYASNIPFWVKYSLPLSTKNILQKHKFISCKTQVLQLVGRLPEL